MLIEHEIARLSPATGYHSPWLEGRKVPGKGRRGLFARVPLGKGELLVVWGGEILDAPSLQALPAEYRRLCLQIEEGLYMVTTRAGQADRVNHSCRPNAGLRGQVALVAKRGIAADEEITYDYAMSDGSPYDEFDCECGADSCRGRITGEDWRWPELQRRYRGYFSPYLERRIAALAEPPFEGAVPLSRFRLPPPAVIRAARVARPASPSA